MNLATLLPLIILNLVCFVLGYTFNQYRHDMEEYEKHRQVQMQRIEKLREGLVK